MKAWLALILVGGLGSCQSTAENSATVEGAKPAEYFVGYGSLGKTITLQNFLTRNTNGLLEVQVDLMNNSSSNVAVEYSFEWFDAQGFKISTPTEHWTPATLNGKHVHVVSGIAPHAGAEKFRIHVRNPQEVTR